MAATSARQARLSRNCIVPVYSELERAATQWIQEIEHNGGGTNFIHVAALLLRISINDRVCSSKP